MFKSVGNEVSSIHGYRDLCGQASFVLCGLVYVLTAGLVVPGVAQAEVPAALAGEEVTSDLLQLLGYDAQTMAAIGVSPRQYRAIVAAATATASALNDQQRERLVRVRQDRQKRVTASVHKEAFVQAEASLAKRLDREGASFKAQEGDLRKELTREQRQMLNRAVANKGLGVPLAIVNNLDAHQKAFLARTKQKHDRVMLNPRNWHRGNLQKTTRESYRRALEAALTPEQHDELQVLEQRMKSGLSELLQYEPTASGQIDEQVSLGSDRTSLKEVQLGADDRGLFVAELLSSVWGPVKPGDWLAMQGRMVGSPSMGEVSRLRSWRSVGN